MTQQFETLPTPLMVEIVRRRHFPEVSHELKKSMDNFHDRLNIDPGYMNKYFTTAKNSILNLVKLQSLVAKCSK